VQPRTVLQRAGGTVSALRKITNLKGLEKSGVCTEMRPTFPCGAYYAGSIKAEIISDTEEEECPVPFAFIGVKGEPDNALDEFGTFRDEGRPVTCDMYHASFNKQFNLTAHQHVHSGERPFSCDVCNKSLIQNCYLKLHQRIHTAERPFSCGVCIRSFTDQHYLKLHQRIQSGERPFSSDVRNKSFTGKSNLKKHQLIHSGEGPYNCDV
jgi:stress-induced morphogen